MSGDAHRKNKKQYKSDSESDSDSDKENRKKVGGKLRKSQIHYEMSNIACKSGKCWTELDE